MRKYFHEHFPGFAMINLHEFLIVCLLGTTSVIESTASGINHTKCIAPQTAQGNSRRHVPACRVIRNITTDILEEVFKTSQQKLELKQPKTGRFMHWNSIRIGPGLIGNFIANLLIQKRELAQLLMEEATNQLYNNCSDVAVDLEKASITDNDRKINLVYIQSKSSQSFVIRFKFSRYDITNQLPLINIKGVFGGQITQAWPRRTVATKCNPYSKYRTIDGRCNNLQNPRWGSAMHCQPRLLLPNYKGASGYRVSANGKGLPSPRKLSLNVHYYRNRPSNYLTHMHVFFGQLVAHEITFTLQNPNIFDKTIECCPPANEVHPRCSTISASRKDPFYSHFNVTCINFVRSVSCPTGTLGPKQVMNAATSTIDASFVYGSSENETRSLRQYDGTGRLRFFRSIFGDLLPQSSDPKKDECSHPQSNEICFQGGDPRANQHTVLTSLHTIFLREHNRMATILRRLNPHWDDERLFQETRRILGAQMQAITYKEYLPITLGYKIMSYYKLWTGRWTRYDPRINPTALVEFTTAGFRFGHTMINSKVTNWPLNATYQPRLLRNEFFEPFDLYRGLVGLLLEGASNSPAQRFDTHVVPDVTNYLFKLRGNSTGMDLVSIDIKRGRDHGLPSYVETVRYCTHGTIDLRKFSDLIRYRLMRKKQAKVFRKNYRFVQDIDLWSGIFSETNMAGAVVGPTAACIIGLQFNKLKYGDRFYFEHRYEAGSFTYPQLQELRKVTLSQLICLNTEIKRLARNVMVFNSRKNPYIECKYVKGIDLSYWKEYV